MLSLHFMYYNFGRIHKTLRVTPAMEAGVSDHVWTLEEIAALRIKEVMLLDTDQKVIQLGLQQYFFITKSTIIPRSLHYFP